MSTNPTSELVNGTSSAPSTAATGTPQAHTPSPWETLQDLDFLMLEFKLVFSALAIIYVGAHAAIRRPPSAAPSKRRKPGEKRDGDDDDDEDEERFSQGMELSDAIMFPFLAGIILVGLYYLIKWLKDPEIINKILRWYMSTMSIVSMITLYSHGFDLLATLVFPRYWRPRGGSLRRVDQDERIIRLCDDVGNLLLVDEAPANPLPGFLGLLARSDKARKAAWEMRSLLKRSWIFTLYVHGMGKEKTKIRFSHMIALLASLATALVYTSTKSPFLSNMLGYGLCYGSFLILSPTDLLIGTTVLIGLFFYDIFMVFYTPYMVTVATTLDVPIKLTFKAAGRQSILGLGDIVLPGIMMAWALRLDLWLHYQRKVKYEATELKVLEKDAATGEVVTRTETKHREIKAPYVSVQGAWANRMWARGGFMPLTRSLLPAELEASRFPKRYFHATLIGYTLGMAVTLSMLLIFHRGQPALLYLVPGVLGALYTTAIARGELKQVWSYTEDGSIDKEEVVVDLDGEGRAIKRLGKPKDGVLDTTKEADKDKAENKDAKNPTGDAVSRKDEKDKSRGGQKGGHKVFYVSLETPAETEAIVDSVL